MNDKNTFIVEAPKRIPWLLRPAIKKAERITGKRMEVARILAWSPMAALAAGVLEWAMEKSALRHSNPRRAKLVRIMVSLTVECPFCLDMNGFQYQKTGISHDEALSLKNNTWMEQASFSTEEVDLLLWCQQMSRTPIKVDPQIQLRLRDSLGHKELVTLGALAAKVSFWSHLIQGLGVPPAGYGGLGFD